MSRWIWAALILCGVVYGINYDGEFFYDDATAIVGNQSVTDDHRWWRFFTEPQRSSGSHFNPYRPLSYFSFWVNYQMGGGSTVPFHFTNILLHLLNGLLVFSLLSGWLRKRFHDEGLVAGAAGFAALIFLFHPIHSQVVNNCTDRTVLFATLFMLASLRSYTLFLERSDRRWQLGLFALLALLVGFLSKEVAAITLLYLVLVGWYHDKLFEKRSIAVLGSGLLFTVVYFLAKSIYGEIFANAPTDIRSSSMLPRTEYLATGLVMVWKYLGEFFWPGNYSIFSHVKSISAGELWKSFLSAGVIIGIGIYYIWWKRQREVTLGYFWYGLNIGVTSTIVPLYVLFNPNRVYFSNIALCFLIAVGGAQLWSKQTWRRWLGYAMVLVVGLCVVLTVEQNLLWRRNKTLVGYLYEKNPDSPALAFYQTTTLRTHDPARLDDFFADFDQRLSERGPVDYPLDANTYYAKAYEVYAVHVNKKDKRRANEMWVRAIEFDSGEERLWYNYGVFLKQAGHPKAAEAFKQAELLAIKNRNEKVLSSLRPAPDNS